MSAEQCVLCFFKKRDGWLSQVQAPFLSFFFFLTLCPWKSYRRHNSNGFSLIVATVLWRLPHLAVLMMNEGRNERSYVAAREQGAGDI